MDRRMFVQRLGLGGGAMLLARGLMGTFARLFAVPASAVLNWGGLRFSTEAVRAVTRLKPGMAPAGVALAAAAAIAAGRKAISALGRIGKYESLLSYSTNAVRAALPHPPTPR